MFEILKAMDVIAPEGEEVIRFNTALPMGEPEMTPEGFMIVGATFNKVGVSRYSLGKGKFQYELRPEEEVFHPDSMRSADMRPITVEHPEGPGLVTPENYSSVVCGSSGEGAYREGEYLKGKLSIQNVTGLDSIKQRVRQLSPGILCTLDYTPGVWNGQKYDAVQRNMRYNHHAMTSQGLIGPDVGLNLRLNSAIEEPDREKESMFLYKGKTYASAEAALEALDQPQELDQVRLNSAKEKGDLETRLNTAQGELVALKADLPRFISEGYKERADLIATAGLLGDKISKADSLDNPSLLKAIVDTRYAEEVRLNSDPGFIRGLYIGLKALLAVPEVPVASRLNSAPATKDFATEMAEADKSLALIGRS